MSNRKKICIKLIGQKSYHILTGVMVLCAFFLLYAEITFTNVQKGDGLYVMEHRAAGTPNIQEVKEVMLTNTVQKKEEKTTFGISKREYEILTRIVEAETTGSDIKGKQIVANVILNRVANKNFPDSIEGVVFQKNGTVYQFSPICDGRYESVVVTETTKEAVNQALSGTDDSQGALYFANRMYANKKNMEWFDQHLKYLFCYDGHEYFTEK